MSTEETQDGGADYLSSPQAAEILRITYVGVAQLARQGKIPAVKIANRWLIPRAFVEEFARTYEGRRGRPRKKGLSVGPTEPLLEGSQPVAVTEMPASPTPPSEPPLEDLATVSRVMDSGIETGEVLTVGGDIGAAEQTPASSAEPDKAAPGSATAMPETEEIRKQVDSTFSTSADVYHLDQNYDFEVYEKGEITERARLIVARLKPKIPTLPQFSFRWDYRYEHLNVDIHGVEPAVVEWWTMGENGYTGHLPRRLDGLGHAFEAVIWLPVTFVFRGRLTLSLRDTPEAEEDSSSVATTTGGLRRLWARWPKIRSGE